MKKTWSKLIYVFMSLVLMINQVGIVEVFAESTNKDGPPTEETKVYHDYGDYKQALEEYNKEYEQYEKDLDEYNQKKLEYDNTKSEADRIEKENTEKKATYDKAVEQYQKDLDAYNKKQDEVNDHSSKGQYLGPNVYQVYAHLQSYLVDYSAMIQMANSGLSISGDSLISTIQGNMAADPLTGSSEVESKIMNVLDQWNMYAAFEKSIYGTTPNMDISLVYPGAIRPGAYYNGFIGLDFYHTFTSNTGQTVDNVPKILDHPTEANIKQALTDLFNETSGLPFDAANQQMDRNTFMVDKNMVDNWSSALEEAKNQGKSLYLTAIQQYIDAFEIYNSSNYESSDFNALMDAMDIAAETQRRAMNLVGGVPGAGLEDDDNDAPFYSDLKSLSASDLANKYGYLKLLSNMASEVTYGYFHLLTPQPGEEILVATATLWSNSYMGFTRSEMDYTPHLTAPIEPTPPLYEVVPEIPDEPVLPTPPVKPIYEPLNTVNLRKVDNETKEPLANAKFQLTNVSDNEILGTFSSNEDGLVSISNLNPGDYSLIEIESPEGYILDNSPILFVVHGTENEKIELEKSNSIITGSIQLIKIDEKTDETLQGAVFELQDSDGQVLQSGLLTDAAGKLAVDGLRPGDYQFVETQAPTGYDLDDTPITFTIEKAQTEAVQVTMTNKLTPGGVVLRKTDAKSGESLQGAVFELRDSNDQVLQSGLLTDAAGKLAVDGLAPGDYQFVETQAPTGYDLDDTPVTFTIEKGQTEAVQVTMTNKPTVGSVVLNKIDSYTGDKLAGAIFELRDNKGNIILEGLETDTNGRLAINDLRPGNYELVETKSPDGYILDDTPTKFSITSGETNQKQVIKTNKGASGTVRVEKRDSRTNGLLQDAKFKLIDSKGNLILENVTTDKYGVATIDGLKEGSYQLVEMDAPTGYLLDDTAISFTVETNSPLLTVTKLNTRNNEPTKPDKLKTPSNRGQNPNTYSPKSYPKTGEEGNTWLTLLGVLLLMSSTGIWFLMKRRSMKN